MGEGADFEASGFSSDTSFSEPSVVNDQKWCCLGHKVPRTEIVYGCQVFVVFVVVIVSLYNLTTSHPNLNLWTILLSSSLGYILPNPRLETKVLKINKKNKPIISL